MEIVGIKLIKDDNFVKYIKPIKDINAMLSIGEIKNRILNNEYVIEFDLMGDVHEQMRLGTDQYTINLNFVNNLKDLELLGAKIEVFLNDELITMEKLVDKIEFLKEIEQEVEEDIDREAQAENSEEE
ncbi:MAG: hypothetical protein E7313_07305 [Clostridiales bacterium]|nr:hypothetical protein [Clostridiales bacterium]